MFQSLGILLKPLLYPFSLLYGLIIWFRNRAYDQKIFSSIEFDLPVISIGNLNTGGTGKTPTVEYLLRLLQYHYHVATMSRGYKRKTKGFKIADHNANAYNIGDEPMMYVYKHPDAIVSVSEDRLTGIPTLLRQRPDIDVILLDDAFQHRSVRAGLNILITDYAHPYYNDYILPFGSLREPTSAAARAEVIIVSKCPPDISEATRHDIIKRINPKDYQHVFFSYISYLPAVSVPDLSPLLFSRDMGVILVSGIANPTSLVHYLEPQVHQVHLLKYPDHHYFSTKDVEEIATAYQNMDITNKIILCTEKDMMRLLLHFDKIKNLSLPIYTLPIEIKFVADRPSFDDLVLRYIDTTLMERDGFIA